MIRNNNRFEDGAIYLIYATCDPYNARVHHHGEEVLKRDGATPIKWVHDDNLGNLYTKDEALKELAKYAREQYVNYQEWESIEDIKKEYKEMEIPKNEWDLKWFKGPGFYDNEEPIYLYGEMSMSYDTMSWGIEEAEGRWAIRDFECGNLIDIEMETYEEAKDEVDRFYEEDKREGHYEEDFYEIFWNKEETPSSKMGRRIKELREAKNLTQTQLAELSGLKQPHIARLEAGVYAANLDTLERVAKALGCDIELIEQQEED